MLIVYLACDKGYNNQIMNVSKKLTNKQTDLHVRSSLIWTESGAPCVSPVMSWCPSCPSYSANCGASGCCCCKKLVTLTRRSVTPQQQQQQQQQLEPWCQYLHGPALSRHECHILTASNSAVFDREQASIKIQTLSDVTSTTLSFIIIL